MPRSPNPVISLPAGRSATDLRPQEGCVAGAEDPPSSVTRARVSQREEEVVSSALLKSPVKPVRG